MKFSTRVVRNSSTSGAGRDDVALDGVFGLGVDPAGDQVDRHDNRQHRQQGRGEKNAALQRGERAHLSEKSSSAAPPSGTVALRGSEATPSFQAITL